MPLSTPRHSRAPISNERSFSPSSSTSEGPGSGASYVIIVTGPRGTTISALASGRAYAIGRRPDSDIYVDDAAVADDHAILFGGDPPQVVDLGSALGTALNGRLLAPRIRQALDATSEITLGAVTLAIRRAEATSVVPVPSCPEPRGIVHGPDVLSIALGDGHTLVTCDAKMRELYERVQRVARTDVAVLLLGETGVGKEVVARAIHHASPRQARALVTVNCAAIPENLMESEFFGHERGAFSGAVAPKAGLFETADRGTLFLDEVGELPRSLQAKLLRVLETGEVLRIGAVRSTHVDVRVVAATNRDIVAETACGAFRADLYYRLNGMSLRIPPLRERVDDIPLLAAHFARRMSGAAAPAFSAAAIAALQAHPWKGNVRELRAVVERALVLADDAREVATRHLMFDAPAPSTTVPPRSTERPTRYSTGAHTLRPSSAPAQEARTSSAAPEFSPVEPSTGRVAAELKAELERREQRKIRAALARAAGNQTDAAKLLGVSRRTLINRMERYGIERPRKKDGGA